MTSRYRWAVAAAMAMTLSGAASVRAGVLPIAGTDDEAVASFLCTEPPAGTTLPVPPPVFQVDPSSPLTGVCGIGRLEGDFSGTLAFVAMSVDVVVNQEGEPELHISIASELRPDSGGVIYGDRDAAVINTVSLNGTHQISISTDSYAEVTPGGGLVDLTGGHVSIRGAFAEPLFRPVFDDQGRLIDLVAVFSGTFSGVLRYADP